ncbi:unnamed protein product, partial [marine sediment metagenome]
MENIMKQFWLFIIITYCLSWLLWLPGVLYTYGIIGGDIEIYGILGMLGTFIPSLIGIVLYIVDKKKGVKNDLYDGIFNYKLGWWWIPTLLLIPLIAVLA